MLPPFKEYCSLLGGLPEQYPVIQSSTLSAYTIGPFTAEVVGQVIFTDGYTLDIWELLDLSAPFAVTAMNWIKLKRESGGTIRWNIRKIRSCKVPFLITNIFIRILNKIVFPPLIFPSPNRICFSSFRKLRPFLPGRMRSTATTNFD